MHRKGVASTLLLIILVMFVCVRSLSAKASEAGLYPPSPYAAGIEIVGAMHQPITVEVWVDDDRTTGLGEVQNSAVLVGRLTHDRDNETWSWAATGLAPESGEQLDQRFLQPLASRGRIPPFHWYWFGWRPLTEGAARPHNALFPLYAAYALHSLGYDPIVEGLNLEEIDRALGYGCYAGFDPPPPCEPIGTACIFIQ